MGSLRGIPYKSEYPLQSVAQMGHPGDDLRPSRTLRDSRPRGAGLARVHSSDWLARFAVLALTAAIRSSIPPPLRNEEYSERRRATSLTEPSE